MTEKTIWFEAALGKIEPVTVIREKKSTLELLKSRTRYKFDSELRGSDPVQEEYVTTVRKQAAYASYFKTWEEAHSSLMRKAEDRLHSARRQLELAQGVYGKVKGMKPPRIPHD